MSGSSKQRRIAFGYNRGPIDQIEFHPTQKFAVQLIYQAYADGQSIAGIVDMLEGAGIPSLQNQTSWGKQTLANILSNPHYVGDGVYPPIITQELHASVQQAKAGRTLTSTAF